MERVLAEVPHTKPEAGPLAHRAPQGPGRELPGGRGFLRLITEPMPTRKVAPGFPKPPPPPAAPTAHVEPASPGIVQARDPEQLSLFNDDPEGAE